MRPLGILGSWNVASKHWIIRQYDHEVQGGSAVKPLWVLRMMGQVMPLWFARVLISDVDWCCPAE